MDYTLFTEIIIISAFALPVVLLSLKFKIPVIVGFLLTGVFINPHLGIFRFINHQRMDLIAELGVICLLFSIGLEFSFEKIKQIKKPFIIGGTLQLLFTILFALPIFYFIFSRTAQQSIFIGCVLSLSSTALVFAIIQRNSLSGFVYARISQAILIFQDLAAILMVIFLPMLATQFSISTMVQQFTLLGGKFLILAIAAALFHFIVIPKGLYYVTKTQSRELFVVAVAFIFLMFVSLSSYMGISPAFGAFIAGILISESPYNHRTMGVILPFKDLFLSLFFVSVGILLDLSFAITNFGTILLLTLGIILLKMTAGALAVAVLKRPLKTALMTGAAISQVGEFSFVLFQTGFKLSLIGKSELDYFLAASVLSLIITPILLTLIPTVIAILNRIGIKIKEESKSTEESQKTDILIVGYGMIGRRVALSAEIAGLKYLVVESNPDTQKKESALGVPIVYGDASQDSVLEFAGVENAQMVVITVPQHESVVAITAAVRRLNSDAYIIARTRFDSLAPELRHLGANSVYVEEREIAVEMSAQLLKHAMGSAANIEDILLSQPVVDETYEKEERKELLALRSRSEIRCIKVNQCSSIAGKTLVELNLRRDFGISVVMIRRNQNEILNPSPDELINHEDTLVIIGKREELEHFSSFAELCQA